MGNTPSCNNDGVYIAGLCYNRCPDGMEHIPGAPTFCKPVGDAPTSYTPANDPGVPMTCGQGKVQSGALCYDDPGPNWKVVAGVAYENCPAGMKDIGAFCIPGAGDAPPTPWYLSFYMLIAAVAMVVIPIIYFRFIYFRLRASTAVATGGKRGGRGRKTR